MKLSNLIWVLALAGAVMACNSGPPISGCQNGFDPDTGACCSELGLDPDTGLCISTGGGTGGSGGGGGGELICDRPDGTFTNACTCSSAGETDIHCDYGCEALANIFGFAAVLDVTPDETAVGGSAFNVDFDGFFAVSEAFIAGAEDVVGPLMTAVVQPGAVITVSALSNVTGSDLALTLPAGLVLDLSSDPNNNGEKGPIELPFVPRGGEFTFGASGEEACFNLAIQIRFDLDITEPPLFPVTFICEPANQEDINADTPTITPEPTAGQVCFTIP